ncbi:MAG: MFS transporter [Oscillospiraceae bacterium]|nr:MFS transporter [Oscillospiraceae bacterium]
MAKEKKASAQQEPPKGRRYVGPRETIGFVLFDVAASFHIQNRNGEFTDRILNISKGWQAAITPFATAWDIINDLFVAAFVDKTRTRFGKFKPYLVLYPLYGIPMSLLFYALPYLFWGTTNDFLPKIILWAAVNMFNELTGTLAGMCRTGMIANITPDTYERLSLITKANFFSMFGEELPQQIFKIIMDVVARQTNKFTPLQINLKLRPLFLTFGMGTIVVSGLFSLYFALVTRERVFGGEQSREEVPSMREQLRGLMRNRPLFMLTISDILGGFSVKSQMGTYTDSILNFRNFGTVSGIPGSPVSYISYAYVPWMRERFSTKSVWLVSQHIEQPLILLIYFFGMIKKKTPYTNKQGMRITYMFQDLVPMLVAFGIQTTIAMGFYGAKKVIPAEMYNECIDYGEWKNGFRSEGMSGALRSMPPKITNSIGSALTNALLEMIGFRTGEDYNFQDERTARGVFALATIIPILTGLIGTIPKLLYNISKEDREKMYADLAERRRVVAEAHALHEAAEAG